MSDIDALYFQWLMRRIDGTQASFRRLCWMLHKNEFERRVGNDINRAADGEALRRYFLADYGEENIEPSVINDLVTLDCSWLEMLIGLCEALDYYYEGGVKGWMIELWKNLGIQKILFTKVNKSGKSPYDGVDQDAVNMACHRVDYNLFSENGQGGLFPLHGPHYADQREVEIWEQHAAYFREKQEGVPWTSTN